MLRHIARLLREKRAERDALVESLLLAPPTTMEQFEYRRGQWQEMNSSIEELTNLVKGKDDE